MSIKPYDIKGYLAMADNLFSLSCRLPFFKEKHTGEHDVSARHLFNTHNNQYASRPNLLRIY